jgi:hypothetical protein
VSDTGEGAHEDVVEVVDRLAHLGVLVLARLLGARGGVGRVDLLGEVLLLLGACVGLLNGEQDEAQNHDHGADRRGP